MLLLRQAFPDRPAFDMAVTQALLRAVSRGELGETLRIVRPGPTLAFGRLDRLAPGFADAAAAARAHGFTPVVRLGGGHAAAYDAGSVLVEHVVPVARVAGGLAERFAAAAESIAAVLRDLGAPATVGELRGEYCAGAWSVHLHGPPKVAGVAQRVVRGAALTTAFVAIEGGDRLRDVLVDVYAALGLAWDPRTAGAVADVVPAITAIEAADAFAAARGGTPAALPAQVLAAAEAAAEQHAVS